MEYCPKCKPIEKVDNTLASELYERILARQPLIFVDSGDYEQFDRILVNIAEREAKSAQKESKRWNSDVVPLVRLDHIYEYVPGIGSVDFRDKYIHEPESEELSDPHGVDSLYHFLFASKYVDNDILVIRGGTRLFESGDSHTDLVDWVRMIVGNSLNDARLACVEDECDFSDDEHGGRFKLGRFLTLIVVGTDISIPKALIPYSARLSVKKLDERQMRAIIEDEINLIAIRRGARLSFGVDFRDRNNSAKVNDARERFVSEMLPRLRGFTETEIRQLLRFASQGQDFNAASRKKIANAKREMVERTGYLKLVDTENGSGEQDTFAGLENLVEYFNRVRKLASLPTEDLKVFNGNGLKGVLLVGMPGCGKSMAAKAAGRILGWPVIGLDIGRLLGKFVGESERNLRLALEIADRAAPCVLWIDELEKAFSGLDSADGTAMRLFGAFLTWLQEKTTSVYVIATANNVNKIPDEFKRKGRFDEIFSILLPNRTERAQIFNYHLRRMMKSPRLSGILNGMGGTEALANACEKLGKDTAYKYKDDPNDDGGFSGADIAAIVNMSVADVLVSEKQSITWEDLQSALGQNIERMGKGLTQRDLMTARKCVGPDGTTNAYELAKNCLTKGGYRSASKQ